MQPCDTTTLTNAQQLMRTSPHILIKIVQFSGHSPSLIMTCKPFYELYEKQAMRIINYSNTIPLSHDFIEVLRQDTWGPPQFVTIPGSEISEFDIQKLRSNSAYLREVDLINCGLYDSKCTGSLNSLALQNVPLLPALEGIFHQFTLLKRLYMEYCHLNLDSENVFLGCENLEELYLSHVNNLGITDIVLHTPKNLKKLELKGKFQNIKAIVIIGKQCDAKLEDV
jgi:hypothetical protein